MHLLTLLPLTLTMSAVIALRTQLDQSCKEYACPHWLTVGPNERSYSANNWVVTSMKKEYFGQFELMGEERNMFKKLFNYINGANMWGRKIPMTVPVLMKHEGDVLTMMFYLHMDDPPTPNDATVSIVRMPQTTMIVRSFKSIMYTPKYMYRNYIDQLKKESKVSGLKYNPDVWYAVSYDEPGTWNRHNEVWLEKYEMRGAVWGAPVIPTTATPFSLASITKMMKILESMFNMF